MKLSSQQNALIYSMPHSSLFFVAHQRNFGVSSAMDKESSFVAFKPFQQEEEVRFIKAEEHYKWEPGALEVAMSDATDEPVISQALYLEQVKDAIERCDTEGSKIVLSRAEDHVQSPGKLGDWLIKLRKTFPHAFIYLLHTAEFGTWLGASPELLIEQNGENFRAVSLAGTRWNEDPFTEKEIGEQATVTQSIIDSLEVPWLEFGDRQEVSYGKLRHLQTDVRWTSEAPLLGYANRLHPTPAVCGFPKDVAYEFIRSHEHHDRRLYTGYLGFINPRESGHLFVNLRCMQLFRDRIRFYAGGGINALSDPAEEWEETVRKMEAMQHALGLND